MQVLLFNAKVTFNDATITNPKATVTATVTDDMGHPVYGGNIDFYTNWHITWNCECDKWYSDAKIH